MPLLLRWVPVVLLFVAPAARGFDYGVFIQVETEEDIADLLTTGEIDPSVHDTLVEILNDGVDLNTADRDEIYALPNLTYSDVDAILAYRQEAGGLEDPSSLVVAEVIPQEKLEAMAPFLIVAEPFRLPYDTSGRLRYRASWGVGELQVPGMWLSAEASSFKHLRGGIVGVYTRNRIGEVVYDPNDWRQALTAYPAGPQLHVPKYFLEWRTDTWHVVGGSYRIGFGQRLTLDNTGWYSPNGIRTDLTVRYNQDFARACKESTGELGEGPCSGEAGSEYQSPDFAWTDRFRGVAVGMRKLELGDGWFQAHGFLSYQTRSIYQYEIYDRGRCEDPRDDEDPACSAPSVYQRLDDPLAPVSRFKTSTLPDMFNELLGGANAGYFFNRRSHIGVTGYGADVHWLVDGMELDFQEWSRLPFGGPFGAVGVDGSWGIGWFDFFAEVARSFDSQPEHGGFAGLLRSVLELDDHEFDAVLRFYEQSYANPYARPVSAADEYDGLRARDELGLKLRYTGDLGDLALRSSADIWLQPSVLAPKVFLKLRGDYRVARWLRPGVWVEYQNKDLSSSGSGQCFEYSTEEVEGEPVSCTGQKIKIGTKLDFAPLRELGISGKYQHVFVDDAKERFDGSFRQDLSAWLLVTYQPLDALRLRTQGRYRYEDIFDNSYLEQSLRWYLEAAFGYEKALLLKARYELYVWLDERAATLQRSPSPAHWLRVELEYRF